MQQKGQFTQHEKWCRFNLHLYGTLYATKHTSPSLKYNFKCKVYEKKSIAYRKRQNKTIKK